MGSESVVAERRVHVVKEDPSGIRALRITLGGRGYRVASVGGGEEAVDVLADSSKPFDLILVDLLLPDGRGLQLVDYIQRAYPGSKLILMSGYSRDEVLEGRVREEEIRILAKPFSAAAVAAMVRDLLNPDTDEWMKEEIKRVPTFSGTRSEPQGGEAK